MSDSSIHTESFKIRASEVGVDGKMTLPAVCELFQEVAGNQALSLNFDISQLQEKNLTWVLHRMNIKMKQYPNWREEISIKTWPAAGDGLRAYRDYQIFDSDGKELGVCLSYWMLINLETRRPVRMPKELLELRLNAPDHVLEIKTDRVTPPENPNHKKKFRVRLADLDMNNHLNNARYVEWMIETLPAEKQQAGEIDIVYLREGNYDNEITSQAEILSSGISKHQLVNQQNEVIALAEINSPDN